ncbi:hypothetical protein [Flavobacterium sp.]|uniref:hypothetical protein n=1 Tax=Flavobacterium sp. TaxID=239 RepID=UPI00286DC298|nr:hypothetical protein [Flavobacterium sp.]
MKKLIIIIVSVLLCFNIISCQKEKKSNPKPNKLSNSLSNNPTTKINSDTLKWFTELCVINSNFDTNKYSKKQLRDTHKLWFSTSAYIDFDGYPKFNLNEKLEPIEKLETEYSKRKRELENLEIVDLAYWQNIKKLKLKELKSFYEHQKTAYFAYSNSAILTQTNYDSKAEIYVDALASRDSLKIISAWRVLNDEQKAKNGSPEYVEEKFQSRLNSDRCLEYAKMDLFTFGWSNYAIKTTKECEILSRTDILYNEYLRLFISNDVECDEP